MRTASVLRIAEGWRVLCRDESEIHHEMSFWDKDFSGAWGAFDFALSRAEIWIVSGYIKPFKGVKQ